LVDWLVGKLAGAILHPQFCIYCSSFVAVFSHRQRLPHQFGDVIIPEDTRIDLIQTRVNHRQQHGALLPRLCRPVAGQNAAAFRLLAAPAAVTKPSQPAL